MKTPRCMHISCALALLIAVSTATALPQIPPEIQAYRDEPKGVVSERREWVLDGNRIRTLFQNTGQVAQWPYQPSGEWPRGSGHSYLDGYAILVAASVVAPGIGSRIHPVETFYREEMDYDPMTGEMWGFNPVPGYRNLSSTSPAMSYDPATWPEAWGGKWYGMAGPDSLNATVETYFVMDDSKDGEWSRPPVDFFPVLTDSGRGGLGLRVEARGFQWADSVARDILIFRYDVVNISDCDYDSTVFGIFMDPGVGGTNNSGNSARYDVTHDMVYAWNPSGIGLPGDWQTGFLGLLFLETPAREPPATDPIGLSSCAIEILSDKGITGTWPKNDDMMWTRMTGGFVDTVLHNTNFVVVATTGPFALSKWTRKQFSTALVFADGLAELFEEAETARKIASIGYHLPQPTGAGPVIEKEIPVCVHLYQNYPNPFNPSTTVRYDLPRASRVTMTVFNSLGQEVAVLVNEEEPAGRHTVKFEAGSLASGVYLCRLSAGDFVATRRLILMK